MTAHPCRAKQIKPNHKLRLYFLNGADDWSRTSTSEETTPSRWRVYQFHHIGVYYIIYFHWHSGVLPSLRF